MKTNKPSIYIDIKSIVYFVFCFIVDEIYIVCYFEIIMYILFFDKMCLYLLARGLVDVFVLWLW